MNKTLNLTNLRDKIDTFSLFEPKINENQVKEIVLQWTTKKLWPKDLTQEVLLEKQETIYIPYLEINGDVNVKYKVNIGTDYIKKIECTTCHTTGTIEQNKTIKVPDGRKIVNCSTCGGRGQVKDTIAQMGGNGHLHNTYSTCPKCYGAGQVDIGQKYRKEKIKETVKCPNCKGKGYNNKELMLR